jgi:hypothetical protein
MRQRNPAKPETPPANAGVIAQPAVLFGVPFLATIGLRYAMAFQVFPGQWMPTLLDGR